MFLLWVVTPTVAPSAVLVMAPVLGAVLDPVGFTVVPIHIDWFAPEKAIAASSAGRLVVHAA